MSPVERKMMPSMPTPTTMTNDTNMGIHPNELVEIVESVFGTMMNLAVDQCGAPWTPAGDRLTSVVHLTGDWCGAVLLECDRRQACQFAHRFLCMGVPEAEGDGAGGEPPGAVDDVVRDVLGELANMIGGNLKCVLTRGTRLSMPSVVDGDYSLRVCGAEVRERLAFRCAEGIFRITILTTRS
jgi:chemotaxis protein CheX